MSERPRSSSILNNMLMKAAAKHPGLVPKVVRKGFVTTIVAQMLPEGAFLKGGSALALRYPLTEARSSRDVDSTFTTSVEEFLTEFRGNLHEGWHGFTAPCPVASSRTSQLTGWRRSWRSWSRSSRNRRYSWFHWLYWSSTGCGRRSVWQTGQWLRQLLGVPQYAVLSVEWQCGQATMPSVASSAWCAQ